MAGYVVGQQVRLSALFTTPVGVPVDPTTVVCRVQDAAGNVTVYTPTRDSTGAYHQDVLIVKPAGTWHYRFEGTGAAVGAGETSFGVQQTAF